MRADSRLRASAPAPGAGRLAGLRPAGAPTPGRSRWCPATTCPTTARCSRGSLRDLADASTPACATWLDDVGVDRDDDGRPDHPAPTDADRAAVLAGTGVDDRCPVVTEPFSEWVHHRRLPRRAAGLGGRRRRRSPTTSTPYEQRKLWLLNGGHSLLAYAGSLRGHTTVAEAVADEHCRALLEQWWAAASPHLPVGRAEAAAYRAALLERFANPRMRHALAQIAADGSQKLPVRILPVLRAERAAGRLPDVAVTVLAAWVAAPARRRRAGARRARRRAASRSPPGRSPDAVPAVLAALGPELADDAELVAAVRASAAAG